MRVCVCIFAPVFLLSDRLKAYDYYRYSFKWRAEQIDCPVDAVADAAVADAAAVRVVLHHHHLPTVQSRANPGTIECVPVVGIFSTDISLVVECMLFIFSSHATMPGEIIF